MSSRSIASARQKRAGEPVSVATSARNGNYIMPDQKMPPNAQQPRQLVPVNKISISDAIGLITIRLGRVEQYIQKSNEQDQDHDQEQGYSNNYGNSLQIDPSVLDNIISRIDNIEKKPIPVLDTTKISKIEQELRDIKDLLMIHVMKYEKFVFETENKMKLLESQFQEKIDHTVSLIPVIPDPVVTFEAMTSTVEEELKSFDMGVSVVDERENLVTVVVDSVSEEVEKKEETKNTKNKKNMSVKIDTTI
jgi:gamma-glutamyl phosphate reductase